MKNKKNLTKKSQAALEFLTTYGWAFLVILIMIATLAYFGILSPSKYLPERCNIAAEIGCVNSIIGQTDIGKGVLRLKLKNNIQEAIIVSSWDTTSEANTPFSCTLKPTTGIWLNGEIKDVEFTNCNNKDAGLVVGEKTKVGIKMAYYLASSSSAYYKNVDGEIFATVTTVESLLTQPQCSDGIDNDHNGCIDYAGGDTGCGSASDTGESGGACPQNGGAGLSLYCFVSTLCNDIPLFRMSALKDAHAEIPSLSNYDYKACCRTVNGSLINSCTNPQVVPLHLSAATDAHVEKNTQTNYNFNVCFSGTAKTVSCYYSAANCLAGETCLATISADTDAHVGDCVTQPFATKICCKIS